MVLSLLVLIFVFFAFCLFLPDSHYVKAARVKMMELAFPTLNKTLINVTVKQDLQEFTVKVYE